MRRFLKLVCFFWLFFLLAIASIRLVWILVTPHLMERDVLGKEIHTVVLGGSVGMSDWNDSIIPGSKNLCASAMTFGGALNNLKWATEYNENKPDTVILSAGLLSLVYFYDEVDLPFVLLNTKEEKRNVLNYPVFFENYKHFYDFWKYLLVSFPYDNFDAYKGIDGGYEIDTSNQINNPIAYEHINLVIERAKEHEGQDLLSEEYLKTYFTYQLNNLRKIKEYCDAHQQTLIIFNTPTYKISDMVSDKGYRQLIRSELGDSTLVAEYTRFEVPDSTYYRDLEHLNAKGALYFGEHIVKEGLQLQYAIDYCMN
jgi:hypothetical protein